MTTTVHTISPEVAAKVDALLTRTVEPVLARHGAQIVKRDYPIASEAVTIEYKGKMIHLTHSQLNLSDESLTGTVNFLLKNFDEAEAIARDLSAYSAPFYSDIHRHVKSAWPHSKQTFVDFAYSHICTRIQENGVRIWS